jgi:hypothetical protein
MHRISDAVRALPGPSPIRESTNDPPTISSSDSWPLKRLTSGLRPRARGSRPVAYVRRADSLRLSSGSQPRCCPSGFAPFGTSRHRALPCSECDGLVPSRSTSSRSPFAGCDLSGIAPLRRPEHIPTSQQRRGTRGPPSGSRRSDGPHGHACLGAAQAWGDRGATHRDHQQPVPSRSQVKCEGYDKGPPTDVSAGRRPFRVGAAYRNRTDDLFITSTAQAVRYVPRRSRPRLAESHAMRCRPI